MVTVARSFDAPVKLLFPKDIFVSEYQFAMLGLGDIVIPGLIFVFFCFVLFCFFFVFFLIYLFIFDFLIFVIINNIVIIIIIIIIF